MKSLPLALALLFATPFFAVVFAAGTPAPAKPAPRPTFSRAIVPQRDVTNMTVNIVAVPNGLRAICRANGSYEGKPACFEYLPATRVCTIYVIEPLDRDDRYVFEAIGHMLYHCRYGDFHGDD